MRHRLRHRADQPLTWKQRLDLISCTECGRCQDQCPAWATDKPLSPKLVIMDLREQLFHSASELLSGKDVPRRVSNKRWCPT